MRHRLFTTLAISASALLFATALTSAQGQRPGQVPPPGAQPQRPQQPPPPPQQPQAAPAKPYKPVAISAPQPISDPSYAAFRQQVSDAAKKKDRAALTKLVAQNFFWMGEKGDKADKKKPGIDNLAKALDLGNKDGSGWDVLDGYASDPTGAALPDRKDVTCAPADPVFDEKAFQALVTSSGTSDWGYPTQPGLEVRGGPQPNAPVIEKLGMHFVRVMQDDNAPPSEQNPTMKVVTPSGKLGFVPADAISPLGNDQLCYSKDASGWKIAGFIGGDQ